MLEKIPDVESVKIERKIRKEENADVKRNLWRKWSGKKSSRIEQDKDTQVHWKETRSRGRDKMEADTNSQGTVTVANVEVAAPIH